jgi:hypothetical protein
MVLKPLFIPLPAKDLVILWFDGLFCHKHWICWEILVFKLLYRQGITKINMSKVKEYWRGRGDLFTACEVCCIQVRSLHLYTTPDSYFSIVNFPIVQFVVFVDVMSLDNQVKSKSCKN